MSWYNINESSVIHIFLTCLGHRKSEDVPILCNWKCCSIDICLNYSKEITDCNVISLNYSELGCLETFLYLPTDILFLNSQGHNSHHFTSLCQWFLWYRGFKIVTFFVIIFILFWCFFSPLISIKENIGKWCLQKLEQITKMYE